MGVEAVEASSVAVTTHVYWPCVPRSSVMIVGRAFETTVEDRNATNIASNIPDSAERIWRWVMRPCCSAGATSAGAEVGTAAVRASRAVMATGLLGWLGRGAGGARRPRVTERGSGRGWETGRGGRRAAP